MTDTTQPIEKFMTRIPHGISPHEPLEVAKERMHQYGIRHLPVRDGGHVVGILSERELLQAEGMSTDWAHLPVEQMMISDPFRIKPSVSLKDVSRQMAEQNIGSALIIDESNHLLGIFTYIDALKLLAK